MTVDLKASLGRFHQTSKELIVALGEEGEHPLDKLIGFLEEVQAFLETLDEKLDGVPEEAVVPVRKYREMIEAW